MAGSGAQRRELKVTRGIAGHHEPHGLVAEIADAVEQDDSHTRGTAHTDESL